METTDLYEAAESLLMPEQAEDNPIEDQADEADVSDDDQDISDDADLSDEDDADPSDSDDVDAEDAYDDEEEVADDETEDDTEEAQLIPVIVDGQEEMWTLDQLKQSASGQSAIRKRLEEASVLRKQLEERNAQMAQYEQQVIQAFQAVQSGVNLQAPIPPSEDLLAKDPIGYLEAEVRYKKEVEAYNANLQNLAQIQQQHQQRTVEQQRAFVAEQAKILAEAIPEYADPQKREGFAKALIKAGEAYGFAPDELVGVADSRYVRALNDAKKWQDYQAQKQSAKAKAQQKPSKQPIRAGAKKVAEPAKTAQKKAQERLKRTGSIDDAVNLIFNS